MLFCFISEKYHDADDEVFTDITQIYNFKSRGSRRQNLMFKYGKFFLYTVRWLIGSGSPVILFDLK